MPSTDYGLTGLETIVFAVDDLEDAGRFASDWGLAPAVPDGDAGTGGVSYRAADGSGVQFVTADPADPARTAVGGPTGMVGMVWGVESADRLDAIHAELAVDRPAVFDADGVLHSRDDLGFALAFRPTRRVNAPWPATRYNAPSHPDRVDQRGAHYAQAEPHEISHLAISVDHAADAARFYVDRLGFRVSDRYAERGMFLRCRREGNHHNLFLMNGRQPGARFNHLAWKVRDHHEVILGGQFVDSKGWPTFAGPGRHIVSSAIFWYFSTPFGGSWEYAADEDVVTEAWSPQDFAAEAHIFSQWTFELAKSDGTLQGPISQSAPVAGSTARDEEEVVPFDIGELGLLREAEEKRR